MDAESIVQESRGGWLWRATLMAALTVAVPGVAYFCLFELLMRPPFGLAKAVAEFAAASAALVLSLMTLKAYNDRERLGLDIRRMFSLKPFRRTAAVLALGLAADLLLSCLVFWLISRYFPSDKDPALLVRMWSGNTSWLLVVCSTFFYAACEEVFLRGLAFTYIKKRAGFLKALLFSSFLFMLLHLDRSWLAQAAIFINGAIFCLAYERTGSLAAPCLLHGIHNSVLRVGMVLALLP